MAAEMSIYTVLLLAHPTNLPHARLDTRSQLPMGGDLALVVAILGRVGFVSTIVDRYFFDCVVCPSHLAPDCRVCSSPQPPHLLPVQKRAVDYQHEGSDSHRRHLGPCRFSCCDHC